MADIDNMRGDTLRVVEENTLDNMRGVTQRVISENSIDNTRGVTYRVYNVNPTPAPVIDELNVTPSTSAQIITAPEGTDGYSPVKVAAVTSAIDANITAGNIKKDVSILGVTGSYEGNVPTGTMYIISNGTYNVADKAIANVQVPTTAPAHYIEKAVDVNGKLINSTNIIDLTGVTDVDRLIMTCAYFQVTFPQNTIADFSSITTISGENAFYQCFSGAKNIKVNFSGLTTITGYTALNQCFGSTENIEVDFSGLTSITGTQAFLSAFNYSKIDSISFPSLTTITGNNVFNLAFSNSRIKTVSFNALNTIDNPLVQNNTQQMFSSCWYLESIEFGGLKSTTFSTKVNQLQYLCNAATGGSAANGCTIHFPSNFDPDNPNKTFDITTLSGYPTFGGLSSYIHLAYDLPATE